MGFEESVGVAESVYDAADIEGVGAESAEAELVEEADGSVGIAGFSAELVDASRPMDSIGDADEFYVVVLRIVCYWVFALRRRRRSGEVSFSRGIMREK